ncbi:precorrin-2 C(20)-methyltransferase, partial [Priestia megaterium]
MIGTLYGLGVGPGDPELITVKAFRKLKESPVIAYPKKQKGSKSYAQKIIDVYFSANEKDMLGLVFPMTKDPAILERKWTETVERVWEKLEEGKDVA